MNLNLFQTISSAIIFAIWLYIVITAIREYLRLMKVKGLSPFITKKEVAQITDIETLEAIKKWKKISIRLMLIWFASVALFMAIAITISRTKGKDTQETSINQQHFEDSLPKQLGYINDFEYLFTKNEKQILDSLLQSFENRTSIQIAVITIDTTTTTADSLDIFTLKIGNSWKVGQKDKNNGVVVGISRAYRKMRIQNGYGIEKILTEAETKQIIDTAFIPSFRNSDYFQGTLTGLIALMKVLEERYK